MKRTAIGRASKPMKRSWLRTRRPKPARVIESDLWRTDLGPCALRGTPGHVCEGKVRGHHILAQQALKRRGLHEFLWDKRNRLSLCDRAHHSHHTRSRPVRREVLPPAAFEFARDVGLTWLLERTYYAKGTL